MPRSVASRRLLLIAAAIILGLAALATPVDAQDEASPAETSPVAVPFVGTYEVWCTERNPGPGERTFCANANHHTTPAIDIGMEIGEPIYAAGNGVVTDLETSCRISSCSGGRGLFVEITHPDGTTSTYLHLDSVTVADDQQITVGQLIGTSGATGQSSSPHLHYDERSDGVRIPFGTWLGCVNGAVVQYPDVFGTTDWNQVEFGSEVVNEGFDCLGGLEIPAAAPSVITGDGLLGIAAPTGSEGEARIITVIGEEDPEPSLQTVELTAGKLVRITARPESTVSVQFRARRGTIWTAWSESVVLQIVEDDRPTCFGLHATVDGSNGTTGPDVIIGTEGSDSINAGSGDDLICGLGGNDVIEADDGDDRVSGGDGRDILFGGDGRDTIFGGPSADQIDGGANRDRIDGGQGGDLINGGPGSDLLNGSTGDDEVRGNGGRDRMRGGQGDDELIGGRGNDRIAGNVGDDVLSGGVGRDRCEGGGDPNDTTTGCEL